ncbi:MAG: cupin domain-containing protein [Corynebacteriales bacterium]|nr:cupin domain-containing protein [Mycobacteriales bacterium]
MKMLNKGSLESPDETRKFKAHGYVEIVNIGEFSMARATFEPGWKWSNDLKPIAGTETCEVRHTGVFLSGRMTVHADDGSEVQYGPGDVFVIEPGHDAWVEGDEPCILLDTGMAPYAVPAS